MVFSSPLFLFLFLPLSLLAYYLCPKILKNFILLILSISFYAWGEIKYSYLMLGSILFNWIAAMVIDKSHTDFHKKSFFFFTVTINIGVLIYFKYFNFLFKILRYDFEDSIPLPLGISFFTFHALSYVIDVYRGSSPQKNLINLGLYISNFSQLVAGPIIRYPDVQSQLQNRQTTLVDFSYGIKRFIIGLGKKVLIANNMAIVADKVFSMPVSNLSSGVAWLGIICYSLQIYFDFSGYSDMAIGIGKMYGFSFLENFNYPYISKSIQEFWKRWHISLSNWFKDYLYIPLGGNRNGTDRTYINLIIVFLLCGIWHGANWNFLLWGTWYGIFLILERAILLRILEKLPLVLQHTYTLLIVMIGWVLFRSDTIAYTINFICIMFWPKLNNINLPTAELLDKEIMITLFAGIIGATTIPLMLIKRLYNFLERKELYINAFKICSLFFLMLILFLSVISFSAESYNPFIYFRF